MSYKTKYLNPDLPDTSNLELIKVTPFGECWGWGDGVAENARYIVVHSKEGEGFTKWFSTNAMSIVNKYLEPNQLTLEF